MRNSIKISIILPVYNGSSFILDCLESLKKQTYKNFEVIIVDDGSTDNSILLINNFIKDDLRFRIFIQPNKGVSSARNFGLAKSNGDYITFLDCDDKVTSNYLEELVKLILREFADLIVFNYYLWYPDENRFETQLCSSAYSDISEKEFLKIVFTLGDANTNYATGGYVWNKIFRREIVNSVFFDASISAAEDEYFCTKVLSNSIKIIWISLPLIYYRQHNSSAIRRFDFPVRHLETRERMLNDNKTSSFHEIYLAAYVQTLISTIAMAILNRELCNVELLKKLKDKYDQIRCTYEIKQKYLNNFYKRWFFLIWFVRCPRFFYPFICFVVRSIDFKSFWRLLRRKFT